MIAQIVYLTVEHENSEKLTREALANANASRLEPGVIRFDVLQDVNDPTRIVFYEVYASADALEAHRQTAHFKRWLEHGVPLLTKPRERVDYAVIDS